MSIMNTEANSKMHNPNEHMKFSAVIAESLEFQVELNKLIEL